MQVEASLRQGGTIGWTELGRTSSIRPRPWHPCCSVLQQQQTCIPTCTVEPEPSSNQALVKPLANQAQAQVKLSPRLTKKGVPAR